MEKKHKLAAVVLGIAAVCTIGIIATQYSSKEEYTLYGSIGNTHCSDYGCSLYAAAKQTACIWFHNGLAESACGVC